MDQDKKLDDLVKLQDVRADELSEEFIGHLKEFRESRPDLEPVDVNRVFSSWAIQKIAGLQILVETLLKEIEDLRRLR